MGSSCSSWWMRRERTQRYAQRTSVSPCVSPSCLGCGGQDHGATLGWKLLSLHPALPMTLGMLSFFSHLHLLTPHMSLTTQLRRHLPRKPQAPPPAWEIQILRGSGLPQSSTLLCLVPVKCCGKAISSSLVLARPATGKVDTVTSSSRTGHNFRGCVS
jgi:hypothetical protein